VGLQPGRGADVQYVTLTYPLHCVQSPGPVCLSTPLWAFSSLLGPMLYLWCWGFEMTFMPKAGAWARPSWSQASSDGFGLARSSQNGSPIKPSQSQGFWAKPGLNITNCINFVCIASTALFISVPHHLALLCCSPCVSAYFQRHFLFCTLSCTVCFLHFLHFHHTSSRKLRTLGLCLRHSLHTCTYITKSLLWCSLITFHTHTLLYGNSDWPALFSQHQP
jgi:hypothetical protein